MRDALGRILASRGFDASARNRRFLEYIVEETLAGGADRLKGLTIAIDVFGRDASIDPQHDPVVRIEAAKLRRSLERYYLTAGQADPVRIDMPKGTYVPTFERRAPPSLDAPAPIGAPVAAVARPSAAIGARPRWYGLTTALLAMPVLGALGWLGTDLLASRLWSRSPDAATTLPRGPKIAVLPFLNLSGDSEQAYFVEGVADQIVTDLARFKALFVLSMDSTAKYQKQSANPQQLKRELGVDYLLDGSVRRERGEIRLSIRLVDTESGEIIWSETYADELTPSKVFEIQDDVSQRVSAIVASNYGMIAASGLTEAHRRPPEFGFNPRPELDDSYEHSLTAAYRAVEIEPRNPTAQLMLANALFDRRNLAGFRVAGERAVALNPKDPEPLAHYGTRLVCTGPIRCPDVVLDTDDRGLNLLNSLDLLVGASGLEPETR